MDIFNALAESNRRKIVELLASKGKLSATEISNKFNVSPQAISQHLKVLREGNVVLVEKLGQQRIYSINPKSMNFVQDWAKQITSLWAQRFSALEELIEEEKKKLENNKYGDSN